MESVDFLCCLNTHNPFQLQHIAKTETQHGLDKTPSHSTPCTLCLAYLAWPHV